MILTDEEIINLWPSLLVPEKLGEFVRAIEALIQEKLAAQNVKPSAYISYKEECETMREQLSVAASEILALRKANKECVEYFNEAQKDLAEKDAEIERLQFAVQRSEMDRVCAKREAAASQAREQRLREQVKVVCGPVMDAFTDGQRWNDYQEIIDQPQDTSALDDLI